jgi:hypothetical protein
VVQKSVNCKTPSFRTANPNTFLPSDNSAIYVPTLFQILGTCSGLGVNSTKSFREVRFWHFSSLIQWSPLSGMVAHLLHIARHGRAPKTSYDHVATYAQALLGFICGDPARGPLLPEQLLNTGDH